METKKLTLEMFLELSKDSNHMKDYAKSIRSLRKIIKNHINSSKLFSLEYKILKKESGHSLRKDCTRQGFTNQLIA